MKIILENDGAEVEITDLMVFIGPDGNVNRLLCDAIRSKLINADSGYANKVIVEQEPERGLFPIAQNERVAQLAKIFNSKHNSFMFLDGEIKHLLLTTHSPYILTALNNYLYAYQVGQKYPDEVNALIPKHLWIDPKRVSAYFVENGTATSIMDEELQQIDADKIDEASTLTNELYDKLLDIKVDGEIDDEMRGIRVEEIDRASNLTLELHTNLLEIELKDSDGD